MVWRDDLEALAVKYRQAQMPEDRLQAAHQVIHALLQHAIEQVEPKPDDQKHPLDVVDARHKAERDGLQAQYLAAQAELAHRQGEERQKAFAAEQPKKAEEPVKAEKPKVVSDF